MIELYYLDTAPLEEDARFHALRAQLSPERQKKIDAFRFRKDQNLSLGAGILLDRVLQRRGLREREMRFGAGENGKPFLENLPELHFNLSHSGTKVLGAFSDAEIGCDVERLGEFRPELAQRFFAPEECEQILQGEDPRELFYRIWTLKESVLKMTGQGLHWALNRFRIFLEEPIRMEGLPGVYQLRELHLPGYCLAYCAEGEHPAAQLREIDLSQEETA